MKGGFKMKMQDFLKHCTACGGNWTRMLMSGIKALFPEYWEAMPDKSYEFEEIMDHLKFLGITEK